MTNLAKKNQGMLIPRLEESAHLEPGNRAELIYMALQALVCSNSSTNNAPFYRGPQSKMILMATGNSLQELEYRGFSKWDSAEFAEAEQIFKKILGIIREREQKRREALPKGSVLYNIGVSLGLQGETKKALRYFLAYAEDALQTEVGDEDNAERGAAYNVLRNYYGVRLSTFVRINEVAEKIKPIDIEALPLTVIQPEEVIKQAGMPDEFDYPEIMDWVQSVPEILDRKMPFGFPQPLERRVFVGGNYLKQSPILNKIKDAVRRVDKRYVPLMVREVDFPMTHIHHHSLLLLHTCKYAIFDITDTAGQLMEIERTIDYENEVLVLYGESSDSTNYITSMVKTLPKVKIRSYRNPDDIPQIVSEFLPSIK